MASLAQFLFFCEAELSLGLGENQRWKDTLKVILPKSNHMISLNDKRYEEILTLKRRKY